LKQKLVVFLILLLFFIIFFCNKHFKDSKEVIQQEKVIEQTSPAPTVEHKEKLTETVPEKIEIVPSGEKSLATSKEVPAITHKKSVEDIPEKAEVIKKKPVTEIPRKYSAIAKQLPPKVIKPLLQQKPEALPEKPAQKKEDILKIETIKGTPENRIALLPFDNFSDNQDALKQVMPLIASSLEGKGFNVVSENKVIAFFCEERMRNISFISKEQSRKVGDMLHVGTIMVGAVTSYSPEENPRFGISARLIDTSTSKIIWADYASETGNDFTKLLGLGTIKNIDRLIPKVLDQLLASFRIEPSQDDSESKYRVAVLPFKNISQYDDAGIIVTYLFLTELFKHELFEPVEYGDVWKMIVDSRIRIRGELSHQNIETLSQSLGAGAFLLGTVENYSDGIDGSSPPDITISARLLDARDNRILWYNSRQLNGDDKIKVLDWGKIRSADKVAHSAVSELVENMETARWH